MVEQKLPFARRIGQKFIILDRGRKVAEGNMEKLNDESLNNSTNKLQIIRS